MMQYESCLISSYTTESGRDYEFLSTEVTIPKCETRACHTVAIVDDTQLEMEEKFNISLERSALLEENIRIIRETSVAVITIIDTDGNVYNIMYKYAGMSS